MQDIAAIGAELDVEEIDGAVSWTSAGRTHVGRVRHVNEDAFIDAHEQRLWAVADGMGGHSRGDYASKTVVKSFAKFARQESLLQNIEDLQDRLVAAHKQCRTAFRNKRVGTTVAALFQYADHCFLLWAGDSRVYRLREGKLKLLTQDHSLAQEKFARGEISDAEANTHPSANVLTRALGAHQNLRLELRQSMLQAGDRYLLCSDGLYNELSFSELQSLLAIDSLDEALASMMDRALHAGGKDNITAVIAQACNKTGQDDDNIAP